MITLKKVQLTGNERLLLSIIEHKEEPINISELVNITRLNRRTVLGIIESLRKKGVPVVGKRNGKTGIKIATTQNEINESCMTLAQQSAKMLRTSAYLKTSDLKHWKEHIKTM